MGRRSLGCWLIVSSLLLVACGEQLPVGNYTNTPSNAIGFRAVPAEPFDQALYDAADFAWGGRLYDTWWSLADGSEVPPPAETEATHPLWPATNTSESGATTWRCKSCHGWDYRGNEGRYGDPLSPYFTDIKGIIPIVDGNQPTLVTPEAIFAFLHDGLVGEITHSFGNVILDDAAIYALTKFIITVQGEAEQSRAPADFIDDATHLTTGIEADGAAFYELASDAGGCVTCHGPEGKLLDFADGDPATMPNEFVDTLARENPWESLHKIRFGQPGSDPVMPGLETVAPAGVDIIQAAIDIVAFSQNGLVPSSTGFDFRVYQGTTASKAGADLARGGILYDEWWTGVDETLPPVVPADIVDVNHPLWTPAATNLTPETGDMTWRCKSCHGWDYAGAAGAYGIAGNSHETGIKGIIMANGVAPILSDPTAIFDFLHSGGVANPGDHAFVERMSIDDIYALTRFVSTAQHEAMAGQAPSNFIDLETKTVPNGERLHGHKHYDKAAEAGGCTDCHGTIGTLIDFADGDPATEPNEFLFEVANDNPWETLHKIRFGNPGSAMQGLTDFQDPDLGITESVDILDFILEGF